MEAHRRVEFTGVELVGGMKLSTLVDKDAASPVEKATAGPHAIEGRSGREGAVEEDGWRSRGAVEREARWRVRSPRRRRRELSFF
jgi:hypothetical protein